VSAIQKYIVLLVNIVLLCFALTWLGAGFLAWNMNPVAWGEGGRALFLFAFVMSSFISLIAPLISFEELTRYFERHK
jgi:hypothetical protein